MPAGNVRDAVGGDRDAVTCPLALGVRVNVKFWLAGLEWDRDEAAPPVAEMSDPCVNVAGSIGSPKSTVTVTDAALVGEAASVDRVGDGPCTVEGDRGGTLEAALCCLRQCP